MNKEEAIELGSNAGKVFMEAYETLLQHKHYDVAQGLVLATFPFVIGNIPPELRTRALAEMIDVVCLIGREVFEDGQDLYDKMMVEVRKKHE
jgi:hypothetical protein